MSVSERDQFQSHLRTVNAATLTQCATLKKNEMRKVKKMKHKTKCKNKSRKR